MVKHIVDAVNTVNLDERKQERSLEGWSTKRNELGNERAFCMFQEQQADKYLNKTRDAA